MTDTNIMAILGFVGALIAIITPMIKLNSNLVKLNTNMEHIVVDGKKRDDLIKELDVEINGLAENVVRLKAKVDNLQEKVKALELKA